MDTIIEVFAYLSPSERELLLFKYKDPMSLKIALCRLLEIAIEVETDKIEKSEEYFYRNSVNESEEIA